MPRGFCTRAIMAIAFLAPTTRTNVQVGTGQSGDANHVAVCPGPATRGAAKCHSLIVTDKQGNIIVHKAPDVPSNGNNDARGSVREHTSQPTSSTKDTAPRVDGHSGQPQ